MSIRVALHHVTTYEYDRLVNLAPQLIRLRPAPHCRTPILSYSLQVTPTDHFVNWQQDPHANYLARYVFPKPARKLRIEVDLVANMTVINPFDFFVEQSAEIFPFEYEEWLKKDLLPFLEAAPLGPLGQKYVDAIPRKPTNTVNFMVDLNRQLQQEISYTIRLEPGVQSPEETLSLARGSCRDSAWLLVQILRHLGIAARFVSGYLIQLAPDVKSLDGPSGPENDFTDLHAWAEAFIPGAGWIGLDPTSGLMAGEGHIPLACTPDPFSAAPITGAVDECEVSFDFQMKVTRIHEDPRVTKPYTNEQWAVIDQLGYEIDQHLNRGDVRLTMGGEPTFVSIDDMDGAEWNTAAVGPHKRRLSEVLIKRLRDHFAPGGMLHYGQGKWYPGESLPRWALACFWRRDGVAIWENHDLIADIDCDYGHDANHAKRFMKYLAGVLGVTSKWIAPAYEDVAHYLWKEQRLPLNVDPTDPKLRDPEERARVARVFERGLNQPVGFVMPLQRQWWQAKGRWVSGAWPVRGNRLFLLPGDSPIGLRLPLDTLPYLPPSQIPSINPADPVAPRPALPEPPYRKQKYLKGEEPRPGSVVSEQTAQTITDLDPDDDEFDEEGETNRYMPRTAICIEPRAGRLHVFLPPVESLEDYLELISAIERRRPIYRRRSCWKVICLRPTRV